MFSFNPRSGKRISYELTILRSDNMALESSVTKAQILRSFLLPKWGYPKQQKHPWNGKNSTEEKEDWIT